jgi:hypothetical protein
MPQDDRVIDRAWTMGAAMRRWIIAALAAAFVLAGCGSRNQGIGFAGPVGAEQLTPNIFKIKSRETTTVQDVLLKAAETAKGAGGTHFKLINSSDANRQVDPTNPGGIPSAAVTATAPSSPPATIKPGQDTYIRVLQFAPGDQVPGGIFQADEIIEFVGRRPKRG